MKSSDKEIAYKIKKFGHWHNWPIEITITDENGVKREANNDDIKDILKYHINDLLNRDIRGKQK